MPNLPPISIPADAGEKADEKVKGGVDYYADLTDDERAEEGLPPREEPPAEKPAEPAKPETPEPETEEEPETDDVETVLEEIASLREDLQAALGKPEPAKETPEEDALIKAGREHDDPVVKGLTERLQQAETKLSEIESREHSASVDAQRAADDKAFNDVKSAYTIGGQPMTDAHIEQVERYILANPEIGARLSIEALTRVVFPDAMKSGKKSAPAKGPADIVPGEGPKVATIIDTGAGAGGGGGKPAKFTPRANETIESAMSQYAKDRGIAR